LRNGVVPIINENDTIAVDEIKVGDNDTLAALVTNLTEADLLIILSDMDGFYTSDPKKSRDAQLISTVVNITPDLKRAAGKQGGLTGIGGMNTKLRAAEIVTGSGEMMLLANASEANVIGRILSGEELGTIFLPSTKRMPSRKRWIAYSLAIKGSLQIDAGAKNALINDGKSLLASGIARVVGDFEFGDPLSLIDENGREFARGLTNYTSAEVRKICGRKTDEIEHILGYCYYNEIIHRDNLVVLVRGDEN
jgi:glutamate 5-kinase